MGPFLSLGVPSDSCLLPCSFLVVMQEVGAASQALDFGTFCEEPSSPKTELQQERPVCSWVS